MNRAENLPQAQYPRFPWGMQANSIENMRFYLAYVVLMAEGDVGEDRERGIVIETDHAAEKTIAPDSHYSHLAKTSPMSVITALSSPPAPIA